MGSPCELLCEADSSDEAVKLVDLAAEEAWRIEDKLSRYVSNNIVAQINSANGHSVEVDNETTDLLTFAETLYTLSDGSFDITSGVMRRVWVFDGSDNIPSPARVAELLSLVGWNKASWRPPILRLPKEMEIDLGGIGKEYAVDRTVQILREHSAVPCLVNFGGDIAVTAAPQKREAWLVGIENSESGRADKLVELRHGALATSGDARRFLLKDGVRYSHMIDPRTGWPVVDAANSITVAADTCTQAGMLSTLAMLKGRDAESFLEQQDEKYWCRR